MSPASVSPEPEVERPKKKVKEFTLRSSLALVGAFLALFCTMGFQNAFGVFQEYYGQNILQNHSEFDIAWIGSLLTCTLFFAAAPAGILTDRLGPTIPLVIGSIGSLIAVFMVSLCNRLYQFLLAQGVLLGISNAFLLCPAMAVVSHLFDRHRAVASGIMVAGSSIGGIIWPIALDQLLHKDGVSFGWSFRIIGFIMLPLCVIMVLTIRPPPNSDASNESSQTETESPTEDETDSNPSVALVKNPTFLLLCGGLSLATFGLFSPLFFLSTYATSQGLSSSLAFYIVSMLNGASLVGRVSMGFLADRYGNFNLCFVMVALSGMIAMCWTKATSLAAIIIYSLAYGFASGAMFSLQTPCAVQLATPKSKGTAIGILLIAPAIPGLVGTPISGHLVERGYLTLSMFSGAMLLGGSFLVLCARLHQSRKLFVKV